MVDKIPQVRPNAIATLPAPPARLASDYLDEYKGWSYAAINHISNSCSEIDINLYKKTKVGTTLENSEFEQIIDHEVLSLLYNVNNFMTWEVLRVITDTYLMLLGEAAWVYIRGSKGQILEIWPLRPDWIEIIPSRTKYIDRYIYKPGGQIDPVEIKTEDLIFFKDFDPKNPYRGYGKIRPAGMEIDIDNYSDEWNRNFFFNAALPSLILSTNRGMDEPACERFVAKFLQQFGGRRNSNKVAFLAGGEIKIDKVSPDFQELGFKESKAVLRDKILADFNLSKSDIGLFEEINRASSETANIRFSKQIVKPRLRSFVGFLNEFLLRSYDDDTLFFNFEDPVPADSEAKLKRYENGIKNHWLTINEVRQEENLPPVEGGDVIYLPFNLQSMQSSGESPTSPTEPIDDFEEEDNNEEDDEEDDEEDNKEDNEEDNEEDNDKKSPNFLQRLFTKKNVIKKESNMLIKTLKVKKKYKPRIKFGATIPTTGIRKFREEKFKKEIKGDIVDIVGKLMSINNRKEKFYYKSIFDAKSKDTIWKQFAQQTEVQEQKMIKTIKKLADDQEGIVDGNLNKLKKNFKHIKQTVTPTSVLFNIETENKKWIAQLRPFLFKVIDLRIINTLEDFSKMKQSSAVLSAINQYLDEFGLLFVQEVNEFTRESIVKSLKEGLAQNEGIPKLRKRISDIYGNLRGYRSNTIARTEIISANNWGTTEGYKVSGVVDGKEWLATRDDRTRETHAIADGQIVELNDTFLVGGQKMSQPGDKSALPEETINCRCTVLPVINLGKLLNVDKNVDKNLDKKIDITQIDVKNLTKRIYSRILDYENSQLEKKSNDILKKVKNNKKEHNRALKDVRELKRIQDLRFKQIGNNIEDQLSMRFKNFEKQKIESKNQTLKERKEVERIGKVLLEKVKGKAEKVTEKLKDNNIKVKKDKKDVLEVNRILDLEQERKKKKFKKERKEVKRIGEVMLEKASEKIANLTERLKSNKRLAKQQLKKQQSDILEADRIVSLNQKKKQSEIKESAKDRAVQERKELERISKVTLIKADKKVQTMRERLKDNLKLIKKQKEDLREKERISKLRNSQIKARNIKEIKKERLGAKKIINTLSKSITNNARKNKELIKKESSEIIKKAKQERRDILAKAKKDGAKLKNKIINNLKNLREEVKNAISKEK